MLADHRWVAVPKPIKDRLKAHSAADGRVAVSGFDGLGQTLTVETPEFGGQSLVINGNQSCPLTATLRKTWLFKGRYILANGEHADLRRIENYLAAYYQEHNRSRCSKGSAEAYWWVAQKPSVSQDGEFTAQNLPSHGSGYIKFDLPPDLPLIPISDVRPGWSLALRCERSPWGTGLVVRCGRPLRAFSPLLDERTFRFETVLPMELALLKAAWYAGGQDDLQIDIPLRTGVQITRVFRDSRTKRPVSGLSVRIRPAVTRPPIEEALNIAPWVAQLTRLPLQDAYLVGVGEVAVNTLVAMLWQRADVRGEIATDADGRVRMCVFPGRTYEMSYERPRLAQTDRHNPVQVIHVPNGVDKIDLEPIEVVQPCTINGRIENASGKPIPGLRIRVICGTDGGRPNHGDGVSRWTTSDSAGQFRFDNVAAGTKATLVPVRAGVPLADPIEITADDKPVRLREKTCESVALGGRIIGVDHKPIAGAQIAIEVTHSPDPLSSFAMRTDADGTFRTPAQFPKPLAYRLVVRTILVDVASSVWLCPAASGNQFPDVVVERSKLRLDSKLSGNEIVAVLNGEPIQASLALERAFCAPLRPDRMTLWYATKRLTAGKMSEHEYRELQETGIRQHLGEQIRTRLLAEARLSTCNRAEREVTENAIARYWKEYLETVRKQQNASNDDELERKLAGLGTSLAGLHREFRYHHLASWYRKRAGRSETKIDWRHSLAWYQAHRRSYAEKEQVRWQLLEIEFEHRPRPRPKVAP